MSTRQKRFLSGICLLLSAFYFSPLALADTRPKKEGWAYIEKQTVVLTTTSGKLILNRAGLITVKEPDGKTWKIAPHVTLVMGESFTGGKGIEKLEKLKDTPEHRKARVTYPLTDKRKLIIEVDIYKDLPGALITCKVLNLGKSRQEYFFLSFPSTKTYLTETQNGETKKVASPGRMWKPLNFRNWIYMPEKRIALITRCYLGFGGKWSFLNTVPRKQYINTGDWMEMKFFIASSSDVDAVKRYSERLLDAGLLTARIASSSKAMKVEKKGKAYYGEPAPEWLRNVVTYSVVGKRLPETMEIYGRWQKYYQAVTVAKLGETGLRAWIERVKSGGAKAIVYVQFTFSWDTEKMKRHKIRRADVTNFFWDELDLAKHPEWRLIGRANASIGSAGSPVPYTRDVGRPNFMYRTCFNSAGYKEACLKVVGKVMEMGADGVFVDLVQPLIPCAGPKFGKHRHVYPGKSNTEAYHVLLKDIYSLVKSYGKDKAVILNSLIPDGFKVSPHWRIADALMLEALFEPVGPGKYFHTWDDFQNFAKHYEEALEYGKVPIVLCYTRRVRAADERKNFSFFTYAAVKMYELHWTDCGGLANYHDKKDEELARKVYAVRMGKAVSEIKQDNGVYFRVFERGVLVANPTKQAKSITIALGKDASFADIYNDTIVSSKAGALSVTINQVSGRIFTKREQPQAKVD